MHISCGCIYTVHVYIYNIIYIFIHCLYNIHLYFCILCMFLYIYIYLFNTYAHTHTYIYTYTCLDVYLHIDLSVKTSGLPVRFRLNQTATSGQRPFQQLEEPFLMEQAIPIHPCSYSKVIRIYPRFHGPK